MLGVKVNVDELLAPFEKVVVICNAPLLLGIELKDTIPVGPVLPIAPISPVAPMDYIWDSCLFNY